MCDQRTDRRTDTPSYRDARTHLKMQKHKDVEISTKQGDQQQRQQEQQRQQQQQPTTTTTTK